MSDIQVKLFTVNMVEENCYLVYDRNREAVMIDCGAYYPGEREEIARFIEEKGLTLRRLLCTHGHFDHVFGADYIVKSYGTKLEMAEAEVDNYQQQNELLRRVMHRDLPISLPEPSALFSDGETLKTGEMDILVIATPGHTPGGVCFYLESEGLLFSGDSLFHGSIGRCDLPGGDESQLIKGLRARVLTLPESVTVLPGHGEATTIAEEKAHNLYLRFP